MLKNILSLFLFFVSLQALAQSESAQKTYDIKFSNLITDLPKKASGERIIHINDKNIYLELKKGGFFVNNSIWIKSIDRVNFKENKRLIFLGL